MDIDGLYSAAVDAGDGLLHVRAVDVRHLVEALLLVTAQKRQVGLSVSRAIQMCADEPLGGFELDRVVRLVKEGNAR